MNKYANDRPMTWQEIYYEAESYREDAIKYNREMAKEEVNNFMSELMKTIRENDLIK